MVLDILQHGIWDCYLIDILASYWSLLLVNQKTGRFIVCDFIPLMRYLQLLKFFNSVDPNALDPKFVVKETAMAQVFMNP